VKIRLLRQSFFISDEAASSIARVGLAGRNGQGVDGAKSSTAGVQKIAIPRRIPGVGGSRKNIHLHHTVLALSAFVTLFSGIVIPFAGAGGKSRIQIQPKFGWSDGCQAKNHIFSLCKL
jgi:hypothetical protein